MVLFWYLNFPWCVWYHKTWCFWYCNIPWCFFCYCTRNSSRQLSDPNEDLNWWFIGGLTWDTWERCQGYIYIYIYIYICSLFFSYFFSNTVIFCVDFLFVFSTNKTRQEEQMTRCDKTPNPFPLTRYCWTHEIEISVVCTACSVRLLMTQDMHFLPRPSVFKFLQCLSSPPPKWPVRLSKFRCLVHNLWPQVWPKEWHNVHYISKIRIQISLLLYELLPPFPVAHCFFPNLRKNSGTEC